MARPTFKIDQARLRGLRQERGLTQEKLALEVAQYMKAPETDYPTRHYQRVEDSGQTSSGYAKALAAVLNVSLPLLQGIENPDPSAYLHDVRKLLTAQIEGGASEALRAMHVHYMTKYEDDGVDYLTRDIAERIEQVQLVRNPAQVADLVALTGIAEHELLAPANVTGFWFIAVRSRTSNSTEIVDGVASVTFRIGEIMREQRGNLGYDSAVRLRREQPWTRIEIDRPRIRDRLYIDITRFQPGATGLRWIDTSWREDFFLDSGLVQHAYANADTVTDFSGKTVPGDPQRLRLIVDEHDGSYARVLCRMAVRGDIADLSPAFLDSCAKECNTRIVYLNWLTAGLRDALVPHLVLHPAADWAVSASEVGVDLTLVQRRPSGNGAPQIKYRIMLAEEVQPGTFERVPMRQHHIDKLQQDIQEWVTDGLVPYEPDGPVPDFETV